MRKIPFVSLRLRGSKMLTIIFLGTLITSCSSVDISSDFDRNATFSTYKTYAFTKEAEALPADDINRPRIINAVTTELAGKGFAKSEQPDVLIDLKLAAVYKQSATAYDYYGAGYRYGWGGGFTTTTINVENYAEGTLFVDMIDASKKQLVWQGRAVGTMDEHASPEQREKRINDAVKQIFTTYPPKK